MSGIQSPTKPLNKPSNGAFAVLSLNPASFGLVHSVQISPLKRYHSRSRSRRAYSVRSRVADAGGMARRWRESISKAIDTARGLVRAERSVVGAAERGAALMKERLMRMTYINGRRMYSSSERRSVGEDSWRISFVGDAMEEVVSALGSRKSSNKVCCEELTSEERRGWGLPGFRDAKGMWLFLMCSGVPKPFDVPLLVGMGLTGEGGDEMGSSVRAGRVEGSMSRPGMGGERTGRLVLDRIVSRSVALREATSVYDSERRRKGLLT